MGLYFFINMKYVLIAMFCLLLLATAEDSKEDKTVKTPETVAKSEVEKQIKKQNQPKESIEANQTTKEKEIKKQDQKTAPIDKTPQNTNEKNQTKETKTQGEKKTQLPKQTAKPQPKPKEETKSTPSPQEVKLANLQSLILNNQKIVNLKANESRSYKYKVEQNNQQGDLYFIAFSTKLNPEQTPKIKLKQDGKSFTCVRKRTDVMCLVPSADYKIDDLFEVIVSCEKDCQIVVQVYMNSEINVNMGQSVSITFNMNAAGVIVNSKLPEDIKEFTEVDIIATVENPYEITDGFKMKAAVGAQLQTQNVQYKYDSVNIWDDGQGIFLTKDTIKAGDSIKLFINGPKYLRLFVQIFYRINDTRSVFLGEDIYDDVHSSTKFYQINLEGQPQLNSSTLYFKLIRYTGISGFKLYTDTTKTKQVVLGADLWSNNHFFITPEQRKSNNMSNKFTISVQSPLIATYKVITELDNKGFTEIQNGEAEFGIIQKGQVDNFIYETQHVASQNNNITIILSAKVFEGKISVYIGRCKSLENGDSHDCIYNTTDQVTNSKQFSEITGTYHDYPEENIFHFTFSYDTSLCPGLQGMKKVHNCAFLFILLSEENARYQLVISETNQDYKILEEGIPLRDRLFELKYNYYRLTLSDKDNVVGVNFFLTTISGDAVILGSITNKFPQLPKDTRVDEPQVKSHAYFIDFNQTSDTYYISVFAYDTSYYALTASVLRKSKDNSTIFSELTLFENIPSINYIEEKDQVLKFYIEKFVGQSFFIDIEQIVGYTWFQVERADEKWEIIKLQGESMQTDRWLEVQQTNPDKPSNYIVSVRSEEGVFSIQYNRKGGCVMYRFSKPIIVLLNPETTRCYSYQITDLDDIDISSSLGNYDGGINNVNITIDINGTSFQLNESSTTIPSTKWIEHCPNLARQNNKNITTCFMKIYVTSYIDIYFNLVTQYQKQEIYLIDGVYQRVKAKLSRNVPRHYYFIVDFEDTITVFLKSFTNTNYVLNARIVSWRQYLTMAEQSVYPLYDFNNDITSTTNSLQTTSLIISKATLDKYKCNFNCLVLISVYTTEETQTLASFDIQASQLRGFLFSGNSKLGFVQAGTVDNYEIKTNIISQESQLIVKVQSLTDNCALTTLRYREENKLEYEQQGLELINNTYVILPHKQDRIYTVQIDTKTTCAYQISLLPSDGFVKLIPGITFDTVLKPSFPQYYLYHHLANTSVNILTMAQFGSLSIEATHLTSEQLTNITKIVDTKNMKFEFKQSSHVGSLEIEPTDKNFCTDCHYLIKLTPLVDSSIDLVVYPTGTPIMVRTNRIINEKIHIGQSPKVYRYNSMKTFYINLDVSVGQSHLKVVRLLDKKTIINYNVSSSEIITIYTNSSLQALKDNDKAGWDMFGDVYLYEITITPVLNNSAIAYSLVFRNATDPLRLREGIPFTINVKDRNKCVTFSSTESSKNGYLIITMDDTNKLAYTITCSTTKDNKTIFCNNGSNILVKQMRTPQSINSEIRQFNGQYKFCVTMMKLTSFTILLSRTNMIHIQPDKELLIDSTSNIQTFDIYNPNLEKVMIQVYQCKGKVGLLTTSNYSQLERSKDAENKVILQRSKTAGHYISTYQPYHNEEIVEIFASVIPHSPASYIIKYSHYANDNPYKSIEPDSLDISYDLTQEQIIFKVDRITNYGDYYSTEKNNYTILISDNLAALNQIASCQVRKADFQTSFLQDSQQSGISYVEMSIPFEQLTNKYGSKHFYATVFATVKASGFSKSQHQHSYKIIYNTIQVNPNIRTVIDKQSVQLKMVFVWIVIPIFIAIILLVLACRFCMKGMTYNPIQDARHLIEQNPNSSVDSRNFENEHNPSTDTVLVQPRTVNVQPTHSIS